MKIAIASQNETQVTGHAGQCRNFWVVECAGSASVGRTLVRLERDRTFHATGGQAAPELAGIDALIAGGMGPGLVRRLAERSIRVFVTDETDIDRVVQAFLDGSLVETRPEVAAAEHRQAAGHGEHDGGCGHCGCAHR